MKKVLTGAALLGVLFSGNSCVDDMYEISCREQCKTEYEECTRPLIHFGCDSKYEKCINNCR